MAIESSAHAAVGGRKELTDTQQTALGRYAELRHETGVALREPLWLALVIAGDKPACFTGQGLEPPSNVPRNGWAFELAEQAVPKDMDLEVISFDEAMPDMTVADALDEFDLAYQEMGGAGWYVARTSWRLGLLPTVRKGTVGVEAYHRRLGCFFGYSHQDIEYFIESEPPRTSATDLVEAGAFEPEEIAYTTFVPERYAGSIDRYERAIETGKTIHERINDLAKKWDIPPLETLVETVYKNAISDCSST